MLCLGYTPSNQEETHKPELVILQEILIHPALQNWQELWPLLCLSTIQPHPRQMYVRLICNYVEGSPLTALHHNQLY